MGENTDIFQQLLREILSCQLAPGAAIFEQDLARRFGVSKSPVREALLRLRERNLVEVQPRSGYRVKPISRSEVVEMYEIRHVYERACVELAIEHGDKSKLKTLRKIARSSPTRTLLAWVDANRAFHLALADACGNDRFAALCGDFISQFDRFTLVSASRLATPLDSEAFAAEHVAIVDAIEQQDRRQAVSLIRRHIEASRKRTIAAFDNPTMVA